LRHTRASCAPIKQHDALIPKPLRPAKPAAASAFSLALLYLRPFLELASPPLALSRRALRPSLLP